MKLTQHQANQMTEIQNRITHIENEILSLIKQSKKLNLNVSILMNDMKELRLILSNLGNLMQLPPATPKEPEVDDTTETDRP